MKSRCSHPRRTFLAGIAGIGWSALAGPRLQAQAKPHRIDVHHHLFPPMYRSILDSVRKGGSPPWTGGTVSWTGGIANKGWEFSGRARIAGQVYAAPPTIIPHGARRFAATKLSPGSSSADQRRYTRLSQLVAP